MRTFLGRKVSARGVLSTESSLGLSFVAQPAGEKSVSRQKQKAPLAWGSGVLHIHLTSPRTPRVYKEQAADWRGGGQHAPRVSPTLSELSPSPGSKVAEAMVRLGEGWLDGGLRSKRWRRKQQPPAAQEHMRSTHGGP